MFRSAGVDIGTTFITVYENLSATVSRARHNGKITETLRRVLVEFNDDDQLIFTGKSGKETAHRMNAVYIDEAVALTYMLSENDPFNDENGKVIDIGASSLTLYSVKRGKVTDIAENTLCAAGTGLFLEEQAERLAMDLETRVELSVEDPPLIASRCTVFARSDLIHHQQEGRTKDEMWSGLCRSLAVSAANTLFRGEELKGKILLCGGVSLNKEVIKWFKKLYPQVEWIFPDQGEALIAAGASTADGKPKGKLNTLSHSRKKEFDRMPPLTLTQSLYPLMSKAKVDEHGNEIRLHHSANTVRELFDNTESVILGMDIGSTSTKMAVLDAATFEPLLDIYGKTAGDPIGAARKVFASFYSLIGEDRSDIPIRAFGTTGSGRYLVGKIFGADFIVNEISAHARGALHFFPDVETIFEIGGQDAKFIRLKDGFAADVNMNYVCAAGTGTFVEEQARKLGFDIDEVGDITAGIAPPVTSDRCTVFMEQDLRALLREGSSRKEALASVLYSVIRNYLTRVVGNRRVSERKIFFQGATARNRGLVAALENLLNVEVVVSPFCHVMGSIGAALSALEYRSRNSMGETVSGFLGRKAAILEVSTRTGQCELCRNHCRINYISKGGGDEFSWGYQCGRDPEERVRKEITQYELFKQREKAFRSSDRESRIPGIFRGTITIINALTTYTFYPLWKRFFNLLGYRVRLSGQTNSVVKKQASAIASADFCFPVKAALGHVVHALQRPDPLFLPYMIADRRSMRTAHSFFCPYMESSASFVRSTLNRNNIETGSLLSPIVDLRRPVKETTADIYKILKEKLDVKKKEVAAAFKKAYNEWETFTSSLERCGTEMLEKLKDMAEPVFVLIGRPYNLHDRGLNLGIPEKIASMGYTVIPIDMLDLEAEVDTLAEGNYHNVFWKYGQRIMAALKKISGMRNVFPIYFSNFNCGPDSFLLSYAEEETRGKPMLILELDEHDSDGGYLTRIEAFLDVVHAFMKQDGETSSGSMPPVFTASRKPDLRGTVWIPPMHPSGYRLFLAAFRACGYDAEILPLEDGEAFALGKKYLNGGECLPMTLTLGAFLKMMKNRNGNGRHILFMPTTEGPCRFGQYNTAERIVFHNLGMDNVDIFSPSSMNSYQGLGDEHRRLLMHAMVSGDVLFKMLTKIRPYERTRGDADTLFEKSLRQMQKILEKKGNIVDEIKKVASEYASIAVHPGKKPLVGIVGEIYVRCNPFANDGLVEVIEANDGEAWLAPMHEWILYIAYMQSAFERARSFNFVKKGEAILTNLFFHKIEETYYTATAEVLSDRKEPSIKKVIADGSRYLPLDFIGEAILTVGRAVQFARQGASMVVNAAPFGCMPGTLSSSILLEIKEKFNIPFVSLFYDGDINVNDKVASLLETITVEKDKEGAPETVESIEPIEHVGGRDRVSGDTRSR
jgi:predicted CoA-substrate-specific enzyme activase